MKKKIVAIFTVCLMCLLLAFSVMAAGSDDLIVDDAHLLTSDEKEELLNELTEASNDLGMDVVVHTTDGTDGKSVKLYADDYLEQYGQGDSDSAVGLVVDMDDSEFALSTQGDAKWYFTDYGVDEVLNEVQNYLSSGDYSGAFQQYVDIVTSMVAYRDSHGYAWGEDTAANTDTNFDEQKSSSSSSGGNIVIKIIIAILLGFGLSFIATKKMKDKMNNVRMKASASDYYNRDELRITGSRDTFLYHTVTKTPRQTENHSSGSGGGGFTFTSSSSGTSHGGGSRHF